MCDCCQTSVKSSHHENHHHEVHHCCSSPHKGVNRRYLTKEEELERLSRYRDELKREIEGVERKMEEMK